MSTAFAVLNGDGALTEIDVFNAEAQGFHDAQAGAIHELGGKFPWILKMCDNRADFSTSHDDGRAALAPGGSDMVKSKFRVAKDIFC